MPPQSTAQQADAMEGEKEREGKREARKGTECQEKRKREMIQEREEEKESD